MKLSIKVIGIWLLASICWFVPNVAQIVLASRQWPEASSQKVAGGQNKGD